MTTDEKLAAILAAVQTDPGNRGLARDPDDNLFTATKGDFAAACRTLAETERIYLGVVTGFFIPTATPPAFETDGPLGAVFLARALSEINCSECWTELVAEVGCRPALRAGYREAGVMDMVMGYDLLHTVDSIRAMPDDVTSPWYTHLVAVERVGPGTDGRCRTMRGTDITDRVDPAHTLLLPPDRGRMTAVSIGIGDGGNEIGMGRIPHETIVKNIPNGDLIHCRVPTDHLIVAGVSNWGAYALAGGIYALRGVKPPADLFDPDRERAILEVMVREGPLVDGVTGKQTATVDGLTWDEYVMPLIQIRDIVES